MIRSGSAWARKTAATGASNSRTKSMNGTPSGAVMVRALRVVVVIAVLLVGGAGLLVGAVDGLASWCRWFDGVEQRVEAAEPLLVDQPVLVDPGREGLEPGRIQVHGPALGVPRPGDQPCLLENLNVLRHRLLGDLEGIGQLVDRCRAPAEPGNDPAPNRIGQGGEGPVEPVVCGGIDDHLSTFRFINLLID